MPKSPNIPVPVMTSMLVPFNVLNASSQCMTSAGILIKSLLRFRISALFRRARARDLTPLPYRGDIRNAETSSYRADVSSGFEQIQLTVASGDRKSTRLNSSHSQISYAVFCLKKKKKIAD